MPAGLSAIEYLAASVNNSDGVTSSHWLKYHSSFKFTGNGFEGLQGFGGHGKPYVGLSLIDNLMQIPFRKLGGGHFNHVDNLARQITKKQNRRYDLDVLRQALTISYLHDAVPNLFSNKAVGCVIGDGFASMTSLLIASKSAGKIVLINLAKTLLVDLWYLKLWMGDKFFDNSVQLVGNKEELKSAFDAPDGVGVKIIAIEASKHELLCYAPVDFAINVASMQEMNPSVIAGYFDDLRSIAKNKKIFFYCSNREEKSLPDGTIVKFAEYPWKKDDQVIFEGLCPWHQRFYCLSPPFYREYDGSTMHKLIQLSGC